MKRPKQTSNGALAASLNKKGIACANQNRAEAARLFRAALAAAPRFADAHNNLGNVLKADGDNDGAIACYRKALTLKPDFALAHNNLGIALRDGGQPAEAVVCHRRAIVLDTRYPEAYYNLGNALMDQGKLDEAAGAFRKALALRPLYAEAALNLGVVLAQNGCLVEAESLFRALLARAPEAVNAKANLGNVLQDQGRFAEAISFFDDVLAFAPLRVETHINLANAHKALGHFPAALAAYERAALLAPARAEIRVNRAMALLQQGRFREGWKAYADRWQTTALTPPSEAPLWDGAPLKGKTILLHAEQGLGDTLQFCRYAPLVKARGGRVVLRVQKPLLRLLACLDGVDVLCDDTAPLPPHDVRAGLLDLPDLFGTEADTIPAAVPYLSPPSDLADLWAARVHGADLKVGLVWAGNAAIDTPASRKVDRLRGLQLVRFAPLAARADATFFSLQKGPARKQEPPAALRIVDFMGDVQDFADTAALVSALDLVIGVDTSVVHLAGAMGKPVFVLSRFDGCWRWLLERADSPWYPSLRLFRQESFGDWRKPLEELVAALKAF